MHAVLKICSIKLDIKNTVGNGNKEVRVGGVRCCKVRVADLYVDTTAPPRLL